MILFVSIDGLVPGMFLAEGWGMQFVSIASYEVYVDYFIVSIGAFIFIAFMSYGGYGEGIFC